MDNPYYFKDFLQIFVENLPKLKHLCLTMNVNDEKWIECAKICQEFASEKSIKLEIRGAPEELKIFSPK